MREPTGETRTIGQCVQRIKELEEENERLRLALQAITAPRGVRYQLSSSKRPTEAQAIGMRAGAADDLENPPPP